MTKPLLLTEKNHINCKEMQVTFRTKRGLDEINCIFFGRPFKLEELIESKLKSQKRVSVLDSGMGEGNLGKELHKKFGTKYISYTGISQHYFYNMYPLLQEKNTKIYIGTSEKVLKKLHNEFDFIIDCFGAGFYTIDKINLINTYIQSLKLNGIGLYKYETNTEMVKDMVVYKNKVFYLRDFANSQNENINILRNQDIQINKISEQQLNRNYQYVTQPVFISKDSNNTKAKTKTNKTVYIYY